MNRHRVDLVSLLSGVAFTGLGIGFLTDSIRLIEIRGDWVMPALAVIAGVSILLSTRQQPDGMAVEAQSPAPAVIGERDDTPTVETSLDETSMWEREQKDTDS